MYLYLRNVFSLARNILKGLSDMQVLCTTAELQIIQAGVLPAYANIDDSLPDIHIPEISTL